MKVGLSSYSLSGALASGKIAILEGIDWIAEHGGQHMEVVPSSLWDIHAEGMPEKIAARAKAAGIDLSSYTIGANFICPDENSRKEEVKRVKSEVDIAARLGVKLMRHDAGWRPIPDTTLENFEKDLPVVASCCADIADYAAKYGITTSVENHGFHFQNSERVQRLVRAVNRPNYRTTLDVGNFICADEDPVAAVKNNIGIASMIHFKDFFRRPISNPPGAGWGTSRAGHFYRGTIIGQGDVDLPSIVKIIKASGYDGYISVEFEGKEDCLFGCAASLENAIRFFQD